jgi:hypothetical protein
MPAVRSKSLVAIVVLLVVLALTSISSFALTQLNPGAGAGFRQGRGAGAFAGGTPAPGGGSQGNSAGAGAPGGSFQGRGGGGGGFFGFFSTAGIFRALGLDFQLMSTANLIVAALGVLLLLLSAFGLWMQKRWALYLAIVVGILFLLGAVPGLAFGGFRFNPARTGLEALSALCALAVIVLGLLPSTRSSVS